MSSDSIVVKRYVVKKGDTIYRLAQRFLDSPNLYMDIYNLNKQRISTDLILYPGQAILIPQRIDIGLNDFPKTEYPEDAFNDVVLTIDGIQYYGWEYIQITSSIDSIADAFEVSTPIYQRDSGNSVPIKPFAYNDCIVSMNSDVVITGKVETIAPSFSEKGSSFTISGRSASGVLVDCAITQTPFEFKNTSLYSIINELANTFGLQVSIDASVTDGGGEVLLASAEYGQSYSSFINSLNISRGVLLTSMPSGTLKLIRTNEKKSVAEIIEGESNILSASCIYDGTLRFSPINVAYQKAFGNGILEGDADDQELSEKGVYRPLGIVAEQVSYDDDPTKLAQWERSKRQAESMPVTVVLDSWRRPDDELWIKGDIVTVAIPSIFVYNKTKMLIKKVVYRRDSSGTSCELTLVLPTAYTVSETLYKPYDSSLGVIAEYGKNILP